MYIQYTLSEDARRQKVELHEPRDGDCGYDLYSISDAIVVPPLSQAKIETGVSLALPPGTMAYVKDRSSMASIGWHVLGGVIDPSYRGTIKVVIANLTRINKKIDPGDKIAQLVIHEYVSMPTAYAVSLDKTVRGEGGFGSTGSKQANATPPAKSVTASVPQKKGDHSISWWFSNIGQLLSNLAVLIFWIALLGALGWFILGMR